MAVMNWLPCASAKGTCTPPRKILGGVLFLLQPLGIQSHILFHGIRFKIPAFGALFIQVPARKGSARALGLLRTHNKIALLHLLILDLFAAAGLKFHGLLTQQQDCSQRCHCCQTQSQDQPQDAEAALLFFCFLGNG